MKPFKLLGIIGDPVTHSLSPAMHNAVLRKEKFPSFYMPFHVTKTRLKDFVRDARVLGLKGFNVTIPHKEAIVRHLSWISPEAKAIGAVNTVVIADGKLKGYNTDAAGFRMSLAGETGSKIRGRTAVVLGAGGAARAVVYALASAGAKKIVIANRTPARARRLASHFSKRFRKTSFETAALKAVALKDRFEATDFLVNTTSVGMHGTSFRELPLGSLKKSAVVSDLVYRPRMTPLLRAAARRGLKTHTGDGMLLRQGAESFRLWTGRRPDLRTMKKALLVALKLKL